MHLSQASHTLDKKREHTADVLYAPLLIWVELASLRRGLVQGGDEAFPWGRLGRSPRSGGRRRRDARTVMHQLMQRAGRGRAKANKLALLGTQRLRRQLRHERHAIALLDEVHKRLQAPTAITEALIGRILQMTELHKLVAEAVPFVQEPKLVATDFGRAGWTSPLKELGATRHIALRNSSKKS